MYRKKLPQWQLTGANCCNLWHQLSATDGGTSLTALSDVERRGIARVSYVLSDAMKYRTRL